MACLVTARNARRWDSVLFRRLAASAAACLKPSRRLYARYMLSGLANNFLSRHRQLARLAALPGLHATNKLDGARSVAFIFY